MVQWRVFEKAARGAQITNKMDQKMVDLRSMANRVDSQQEQLSDLLGQASEPKTPGASCPLWVLG